MGYDTAVKIGKLALAENITLKEAAQHFGYVRPVNFDRRMIPAAEATPCTALPGGDG
jgi:fumarate hydratase class II